MAKHRHSHKRSHRRSHGVKRGGGNYSSASSYGSYVNGSGNSQFDRVFEQSGAYSGRESNILVGAQGQWAQQTGAPSAQNLALVQSAGGKRKSRRGGLIGEVVNQAVVPLTILGLQQNYGKKKHGGKTRKRHGGLIGEVINQAIVPFGILGLQQTYKKKSHGGKTHKHRKH
jgi:hypothetical protein